MLYYVATSTKSAIEDISLNAICCISKVYWAAQHCDRWYKILCFHNNVYADNHIRYSMLRVTSSDYLAIPMEYINRNYHYTGICMCYWLRTRAVISGQKSITISNSRLFRNNRYWEPLLNPFVWFRMLRYMPCSVAKSGMCSGQINRRINSSTAYSVLCVDCSSRQDM